MVVWVYTERKAEIFSAERIIVIEASQLGD